MLESRISAEFTAALVTLFAFISPTCCSHAKIHCRLETTLSSHSTVCLPLRDMIRTFYLKITLSYSALIWSYLQILLLVEALSFIFWSHFYSRTTLEWNEITLNCVWRWAFAISSSYSNKVIKFHGNLSTKTSELNLPFYSISVDICPMLWLSDCRNEENQIDGGNTSRMKSFYLKPETRESLNWTRAGCIAGCGVWLGTEEHPTQQMILSQLVV